FLDEASEFDFVEFFPLHTLEKFLELVGPSISRPLNTSYQVSNFEARCHMVREGLGLAIMPEKIAVRYADDLNLKMVRLKDEWAKRKFLVCHNENHVQSKESIALLEHLKGDEFTFA